MLTTKIIQEAILYKLNYEEKSCSFDFQATEKKTKSTSTTNNLANSIEVPWSLDFCVTSIFSLPILK